MTGDVAAQDLLRELAPQVLGALVRRYRTFDAAEDAVQEALLAASIQWPRDGTPDNPLGWLVRVASRRLIDEVRSETSRRRREESHAAHLPDPAADNLTSSDDTLVLLSLCCHPVLTAPSQIALTLRAVGGLSTAEIAHAFFVPEPTMAQRISRAKRRISNSGVPFQLPPADEQAARRPAVLHTLYLIFNEGYVATSGRALQRTDLTREAIRLTRMLRSAVPDDGEVMGLLALMLLTDARRPARTGPNGELVPLAEQDRGRWDTRAIQEGVELVTTALSTPPAGPYQLQAAIAAVHDEAPRTEVTDWPQIAALYRLLRRLDDNPMVALSQAVAEAMVHGPRAGLAHLAALDSDDRMARNHRLPAVRAHLLEMAGDTASALTHYRTAASLTTSLPERRYLQARAARLRAGELSPGPAG